MGIKTGINKLDLKNNKVLHLTVDAMLCAIGVVGRVFTSTLPNIQPVTAIIILMAVYIGITDAVLSSFVIVTVTNLVLSHGVWSFYQFIAWAAIGIISGLIFKKCKNAYLLIIWAFLSGYFFGALVSVFSYKTFISSTGQGYIVYWLSGVSFDTYHALGNAVFVWALYPIFEKLFAKNKD